MTEKQYKGIAGNFLICDVQKEYAEHLLSILVKRFGMRFQFHFFSNVKKIEQFAEKAEIEILLIAEDCVSEIRGNVKAKKKFILSESMKKEEKQGETTIFRYQSADEILKIIQSGIGEEEAKAAHKPQKKTEEKYDAVQSDFISIIPLLHLLPFPAEISIHICSNFHLILFHTFYSVHIPFHKIPISNYWLNYRDKDFLLYSETHLLSILPNRENLYPVTLKKVIPLLSV